MQKQFFTLLFIAFIISCFAQPIAAQEVSQSYEVLMQSGSEKYDAGDFISAKTYFEMALQKKKDDETAQKKLNETVEKIKQQMQKQEGFYLKLDQGDRLLALNKLKEAKAAYHEALQVFPDDKYTLAQLSEINKTLAAEQNKLDSYNNALNLGTTLLEQAKYEEAILQFQEAIALYPEQEIPIEKLAEAKNLLEKRKLTQAKAAEFAAEAENLILRKDYNAAIKKLEEAQTLTPEDETTAQRLAEIRTLAEKSAAYNTILAKADEQYANKNFDKAREQYQAALQAWPGQAYAEDMILRINQTLESEAYLAQQQYNDAMAEAANYEADDALEQAISSYEKALTFKTGDELALEKIAAIQAKIIAKENAEQLAAQIEDLMAQGLQLENDKQYEASLGIYQQVQSLDPDKAGLAEKIAEIQALVEQSQQLEENYAMLMETAEVLLTQNSLREARAKFVEAFNIKPSAAEPQEKINQIDRQLAALAQQEEALENEYTKLISLASEAYDKEELALALDYYQQAAQLKPEQQQLSSKIGEINAKMDQQQQLEQRENKYNELIVQADQQLEENKLAEAKGAFQQAAQLFTDRTYPAEKIAEIEVLQQEIAAANALEANFNKQIESADAAFANGNLNESKEFYEAALQLKASDHADMQIEKINELLAEQAAAEALDLAFTQQVQTADSLFVLEEWEAASIAYQDALKLNPSASYPKSQLAQIEETVTAIIEQKALESQIASLTSQADESYNNNKLDQAQSLYEEILALDAANAHALSRTAEISIQLKAAAAERQLKFDEAIAAGEQFLADKSYRDAYEQYQIARGLKPDDESVKARIKQIDDIIKAEKLKLMTNYNKIIKEADQFLQSRTYDKAIELYNKADLLKTGETYPAEMIAQITQTIQENKLVDLNLNPVIVTSGSTKRFEFEPVNITERRSNYIFVKARNTGTKGFPLIVSFGSKSGRNGGFVLPIPDDDQYHDFVIRIGSQYKWFSEDNTWIEVLPENGEVELGIMQISKGF